MLKFFRLFIFTLLVSMLFTPHAQAKWRVSTLPLNGEWEFHSVDGVFTVDKITAGEDLTWRPINVPANWHLEGIDHHGSAIYRKAFQFDLGDRTLSHFLEFSGVDYAADIWLNGTYVGSHQGYFHSFGFDITKHLLTGENIIQVVVHSPNEEFGSVWSLQKQLIKGIFNHHDTRPGGAWSTRGQEMNTGGIWSDVLIKTTGPAAFKNVKLSPSFDENLNGRLRVQFDVNGGSPRVVDSVSIRVTPHNFSGPSQRQKKKLRGGARHSYEVDVDVKDVRLWWPYDLGAPNLYEVELTIYSKGQVTDTVRRIFGFRTVERHAETGEWRINGKRFFLRGTNYIATQWLSEMSDEDYDVDLALMRGAHINTVRVHAHIGAKPFYEAADRIGMLVWQDFPLQWGYDDSPDFHAEAKKQAVEMVDHLNDHPSVIAWSMQNEPPWDADWMKYKYDNYDPEQNKTLTNALYTVVKAHDETRYTHSHSATAEHPWLGWYSGSWLDYAKPTTQSLVTEFGAQALPNAAGLRRIFPEDALFPDDDKDWALWSYHNFQKHELTNVAGVSIGENIDEFIENTQQYQAKLTKFAAENLRRQKYNPVGGAFQFMFNEDWPSVNWGILDYWRDPKPGYQALKTAYQPILASLEWRKDEYAVDEDVEVGLWVINDLYETHPNATFDLSLRTPKTVLDVGSYTVNVSEDDVQKIAVWRHRMTEQGNYVLVAHLRSSKGDLLSSNSFNFTVNVVK